MVVKIVPNDKANGKLADAELHFTDGVRDGLKLIGFAGISQAEDGSSAWTRTRNPPVNRRNRRR